MQPMPVAKKDAPVWAVRPIGEPAIETIGLQRCKPPEFASSGSVECHDLRLGRRGIENPGDDQRIALYLCRPFAQVASMKYPGNFQLRDICRGNLGERRIVARRLV